ncbi:MAG: hypothetical protein RDV41_15290, partial [Planctomycetota bacterium]|nr:hypothetical protein [Planctomycetota bacterium]
SGTVSAVVNGVAIVQTATVTYTPGPATHFQCSTGVPPVQVRAGEFLDATITALDQFDNVATGYDKSVTVTLTGTTGPNGTSAGPAEFVVDFTGKEGIVSLPGAIAFGAVGEQSLTATGPDPTDPTKTITGALSGITVTPGAPALLTKVSGDEQQAVVGALLENPLVALVQDLFGNPVPGRQVIFEVTEGKNGGSFIVGHDSYTTITTTTNDAGNATSPPYKLGADVGVNTIEGRMGLGLPSDPQVAPVTYTVHGLPQVTALHITVPTPPSGAIEAGQPVQGVTVEALDASGSVATTFSGVAMLQITGFTAPNGSVTFPHEFGLNIINGVGTPVESPKFAAAGAQTVSATLVAFPEITGSTDVTVLGGTPAAFTKVSGDNQIGACGSTLPLPFVTNVGDEFGNPCAGRQVQYAVLGQGGATVSPAGTLVHERSNFRTAYVTLEEKVWVTGPDGMPVLQTIHKQYIYVFCGVNGSVEATVERFDPETNTSTIVGSLIAPRYDFTLTYLSGTTTYGHVFLVAGGVDPGTGVPLNSAELFRIPEHTSSLVGPMIEARYGHTATVLPNGQVLIAGGCDSTTAEIFDPIKNRFTESAPMNSPRKYHTATSFIHEELDPATNKLVKKNRILLAGGSDDGSAEIFE